MKNTLKGINKRRHEGEQISELKTDRQKSLPWNRIQKKRMKRNKNSLRDLWDNI